MLTNVLALGDEKIDANVSLLLLCFSFFNLSSLMDFVCLEMSSIEDDLILDSILIS